MITRDMGITIGSRRTSMIIINHLNRFKAEEEGTLLIEAEEEVRILRETINIIQRALLTRKLGSQRKVVVVGEVLTHINLTVEISMESHLVNLLIFRRLDRGLEVEAKDFRLSTTITIGLTMTNKRKTRLVKSNKSQMLPMMKFFNQNILSRITTTKMRCLKRKSFMTKEACSHALNTVTI